MSLSDQVAVNARPGFWSAHGLHVEFVERGSQLQNAREVLSRCELCAIDAEWQPGSSRPRAALLQLACRTATKDVVFLLDMMALTQPAECSATRQTLQALLRSQSTVKVGYGVEGDLRAVANALGTEGGGCIARAEPIVDIGVLHKHLMLNGAPAPRADGTGLSGLVRGVLGVPLDKTEQCSAWHKRPLSDAQLVYAATDAAVLLALLDAFAAAAQPQIFPFRAREHGDAIASTQAALASEGAPAHSCDVTVAAASAPCVEMHGASKGGTAVGSSLHRQPTGVPVSGHREESAAHSAQRPPCGVSAAAHDTARPQPTERADDPLESCPVVDSQASIQMRRYNAGVVGASAWAERCSALDDNAACAASDAPGFAGSKQRVGAAALGSRWPSMATAPASPRTQAAAALELPKRMTRMAVSAARSGVPGPLASFPLLSLSAEILSEDDACEPESLAAEVATRGGAQRPARRAADADDVAAAWSFRIEYEGGRFRRVGMPRSVQTPEAQAASAMPAFVPWLHGSARQKLFVCDVMLEGLARQMRLFGLDVLSMQQRDKRHRSVVVRGMLAVGTAEQRLVLTGDRLVLRMRGSEHAYLVRAKDKRAQLREVLSTFGVQLDPAQIMSRCTFCGGTFGERTRTFAELPAACTVPEAVRGLHDEFWVCTGCRKVFWQGEQYESAMRNLSNRCRRLSGGPAAACSACATTEEQ